MPTSKLGEELGMTKLHRIAPMEEDPGVDNDFPSD